MARRPRAPANDVPPFVVKVQMPIEWSKDITDPEALAYTKGRMMCWMLPTEQVQAKMGARAKAYFTARQTEDGLELLTMIEDQPW